jgi:hypothetical protein
MARKRQAKKKARKRSSKGRRTRKKTAKRDPWTPWGKWAKARRERIARKKREREKRREDRQRARQLRRLRRRRVTARGAIFLGLVALACVIGGLVLVLLGRPYPWEAVDDTAEMLALSRRLAERHARWDRLAVHHYTIEVSYTAGQVRCGPITLEVQDGRVLDPPTATGGHWFPEETCDALLDSLTVEGAFDWLQGQMADFRPGSTYLTVEFDPDFGYPVDAERGVYGDQFPGCCWRATWRDLRPLD